MAQMAPHKPILLHPRTAQRLLKKLVDEEYHTILSTLPPNEKISVALDCRTSTFVQAFMAIAGYFIDRDWSYREIVLGFEKVWYGDRSLIYFAGPHTCTMWPVPRWPYLDALCPCICSFVSWRSSSFVATNLSCPPVSPRISLGACPCLWALFARLCRVLHSLWKPGLDISVERNHGEVLAGQQPAYKYKSKLGNSTREDTRRQRSKM